MVPESNWNLEYEKSSGRIILNLTMSAEGCYRVQVSYSGITLVNGTFECVVLSGELTFHGTYNYPKLLYTYLIIFDKSISNKAFSKVK